MLPCLLALLLLLGSTDVWAETLSVSSTGYTTVQAAVDAAADDDVIEIAPGTYAESVVIAGKNLTLQSDFATSGDPAAVLDTVIGGAVDLVTGDPLNAVEVKEGAADKSAHVVFIGLTIADGDSGLLIRPNVLVEFNDGRVVRNDDGVELEGRGTAAHPFARAIVRRSVLELNTDDGVDVDQRAELWIEDSVIQDNDDDGIEIRLQGSEFAAGEQIRNVILRNRMLRNDEDGLQLIDGLDTDPQQLTPRSFRVERNVFADNVQAGLGIMCNQISAENYEGCAMLERVELVHNTFVGNDYGLTGGANLIGVSNLFVSSTNVGVKNVVLPSRLADSLFYANGVLDHEGSDGLDLPSTHFADPLLGSDFTLGAGSPAIDAGPARFSVLGETILDLGPCDYRGEAPDLGALERDTGPPELKIFGMLLASASEGALEKGGKLKASVKRLDLGSSKGDVIAGLRFEEIGIPPGAVIEGAHIELVSAKKGTKPAALVIAGEAGGNAAPFGAANGLAARIGTSTSEPWNVPPWPAAGASVQSPDLTDVVQEIVDDPDWAEGNALALFAGGTGKRSVVAFDGAAAPPLLHVDFFTTEPACVP